MTNKFTVADVLVGDTIQIEWVTEGVEQRTRGVVVEIFPNSVTLGEGGKLCMELGGDEKITLISRPLSERAEAQLDVLRYVWQNYDLPTPQRDDLNPAEYHRFKVGWHAGVDAFDNYLNDLTEKIAAGEVEL